MLTDVYTAFSPSPPPLSVLGRCYSPLISAHPSQHPQRLKIRRVRAMVRHWLMKAEPDSRIVKGKDVKVSGPGHSRSLAVRRDECS